MVPRKGVGAGGGDAFGSCTFKIQLKTLAILRDYEYMISERKGGGGGGGGARAPLDPPLSKHTFVIL